MNRAINEEGKFFKRNILLNIYQKCTKAAIDLYIIKNKLRDGRDTSVFGNCVAVTRCSSQVSNEWPLGRPGRNMLLSLSLSPPCGKGGPFYDKVNS